MQKLNLKIKQIGPMIIIAALTAIYCAGFIDPISRTQSHEYRMWIAIIAVFMIVMRYFKELLFKHLSKYKQAAVINIYMAILVITSTFGVFNYYQFDKDVIKGMDDYTDIAYYYLNSKYLDELGYFNFYSAMLYADLTYKNRHASKIVRYRDLRDYEVKSTHVAFEHGLEIKEHQFTKKRWEQFTHDVDWFLARKTTANLQGNFFVDHGYNPPPTWAVAGGILANIAPVESVKMIAVVDVLFVIAMLIGVIWAFGFETMLYIALFFLFTFSGRWPVLTHSLLRFDWSALLVLSICAFKKERWVLAGALLSYAALTRIFPAIFFFAWGVVALKEIIKYRSVPVRHIKVAAGAAVMALVLIVTALAMYGSETFEESAHNLIMHNESFSSHRVGLGDLLVYDGETSRDDIRAFGGMGKKELMVQALQPELRLTGILMLLFTGFYIWRTDKKIHNLIYLAIIPFYCITNPQINYYYVRMTLVLWHASNINKPLHKAGLILLFSVDIATQYVFLQHVPRYTVTVTTSIGMAIYFSVLIAVMIYEISRTFFKSKKNIQPGSPVHT